MALYRVIVSGGIVPSVIVNAHSTEMALQFAKSMVVSGQPVSASLATPQDVSTIPLASTVDRGDMRPAIQSDPDFIRSMGMAVPGLQGAVLSGTVPAPAVLPKAPELPAGMRPDFPFTGGGAGAAQPTGLAFQQPVGQPGAQAFGQFGQDDIIPAGGSNARQMPVSNFGGEFSSGKGGLNFTGNDPIKLPPLADWIEEAGGLTGVDPMAAVMRGLARSGLPSLPQSIGGRSLLRFAPEFKNIFDIQSNLQTTGNPNLDLESFVQSQGGSIGNARGLAVQLMNTLLNTQMPTDPKAALSEVQKGVQQFREPDTEATEALRDLAMSALHTRVAPSASSMLNIPSAQMLRSEWIARGGGATNGQNFIEFLRQRLPIGAALGSAGG